MSGRTWRPVLALVLIGPVALGGIVVLAAAVVR